MLLIWFIRGLGEEGLLPDTVKVTSMVRKGFEVFLTVLLSPISPGLATEYLPEGYPEISRETLKITSSTVLQPHHTAPLLYSRPTTLCIPLGSINHFTLITSILMCPLFH